MRKERTAHRDRLVYLVHQVLEACKVTLEVPVQWVHQDCKVHRVHKETWVCQVMKDQSAHLGQKVALDREVHLVLAVHLVIQVSTVIRENVAPWA